MPFPLKQNLSTDSLTECVFLEIRRKIIHTPLLPPWADLIFQSGNEKVSLKETPRKKKKPSKPCYCSLGKIFLLNGLICFLWRVWLLTKSPTDEKLGVRCTGTFDFLLQRADQINKLSRYSNWKAINNCFECSWDRFLWKSIGMEAWRVKQSLGTAMSPSNTVQSLGLFPYPQVKESRWEPLHVFGAQMHRPPKIEANSAFI